MLPIEAWCQVAAALYDEADVERLAATSRGMRATLHVSGAATAMWCARAHARLGDASPRLRALVTGSDPDAADVARVPGAGVRARYHNVTLHGIAIDLLPGSPRFVCSDGTVGVAGETVLRGLRVVRNEEFQIGYYRPTHDTWHVTMRIPCLELGFVPTYVCARARVARATPHPGSALAPSRQEQGRCRPRAMCWY